MIGATLATIGLGAAAGGWFLAPHAARRRAEAQLRLRCAREGTLALTFDDGPGPSLTPKLLDLLAARGARATFFPLGESARRHPALLDRIRAEGHAIGCHTDRHLHAWRSAPWRVARDVEDGYRALAPWIAADAPFRPPFGKMTAGTWQAVRRRGAPLAWWTIDSLDSRPDRPIPEAVAEAAIRAGGGVVLMHDLDAGPEREAFVLKSVALLLDAADEHGWDSRTLFPPADESLAHAA